MPYFDDTKQLYMNPIQFQLAITGSRLNKTHKDIVRKVLVDQIPRHQVSDEEGITKQKLSRILKSVEHNFHKQLEKNRLQMVEVIVKVSEIGNIEIEEKKLLDKMVKK